jgi:anti-sigma regulatory factor (Ser/Thr protein kinase)
LQQRTTTRPLDSKNGGGGASLALSVARDMKLIATVRRFVGELCVRVIGDSNVTARVVIATHELLDNAVRHGRPADQVEEHARIQVVVGRVDDNGIAHVTIDTSNRIEAAHLPDLEKIFAALHADTHEQTGDRDRERRLRFYRELLKRAAQRDAHAGLGLGRVHAESEMNLSSRFTQTDGLFHVRAEGFFPVLPAFGGGR